MKAFELACSAQQSYGLATAPEKRELILRLSSNRFVAGKDVVVEPYLPLWTLAKRDHVSFGAGYRTRTCDLFSVNELLYQLS